MLKIALFLALFAPMIASADDPTQERNEAIATVSTSVVTLQKMESQCVNAKIMTASMAKNAIDAWRQRNDVFLYTQTGYLNAYFKAYAKEYGEAAAQTQRKALNADINAAADGNIKVLLDKKSLKQACPSFFEGLNKGKYDININYPYYPTLKEMVELLGLADRLPKN